MIKLRTIQHTGTQFFKQLFRAHGVSFNHKHLGRDDMPDHPGDITVCTVRDPKTCYISTKSRGRYDQCFHKGYQELNELWEQQSDKIFFIPIDQHDKAQQILNKLSDTIGIKLSTDWEPISSRRHKTNIELIDLSIEYSLPVIEAFYGQTTVQETEKTENKAPKKRKKTKRAKSKTRTEVPNEQATPTESHTESNEQ